MEVAACSFTFAGMLPYPLYPGHTIAERKLLFPGTVFRGAGFVQGVVNLIAGERCGTPGFSNHRRLLQTMVF